MKLLTALTATFGIICGPLIYINSAEASAFCEEIKGATLVANDGTYLGKIDSEYETESIFNPYGTYGSEYSLNSIWNKYGLYGGKYSINSPFNKYTTTPPTFYTTNNKTGKLTINTYLPHSFNPYRVKACFD